MSRIRDLCKPRALPKNGTIGVIAPASPVDAEKLNRGVRYLESLGYRVEVGRSAYAVEGYLAGDDTARLDDLMEMFTRPDIDAIFCARGGYGSSRLLARIDYAAIARNPKIFVGYSDITALHLALYRHAGLLTFSGPMVAVEFAAGIDSRTEAFFWRLLSDPRPVGQLPAWESHPAVLRHGEAEGQILAGCLSILASIAGTPFFPATASSILLFEEIGELPYRVDRAFAQLQLAGLMEKVAAVLIGQFCDCDPEPGKPSWAIDEVLRDYFGAAGYAVVSGIEYGHNAVKLTIPIGARMRVRTEPVEIELIEGVVLG